MHNELSLTLNAQFFSVDGQPDDVAFRSILDAAIDNADPSAPLLADDFRQVAEHSSGTFEYRYSLRIFLSERAVYFLPEVPVTDKIYAFILMLEIDGYVAILKKSCANISESLEGVLAPATHEELASTFEDDEVTFQKLSVRNMTVSDKAVRTRSYEAVNLQGLLSTHAAGRSIPFFVRVRKEDALSSLSLNSARLFESSDRLSVDQVALWASENIAKIKSKSANKQFLSSFAKRIELAEVLKISAPSAVLVESGALYDRLRDDGLVLMFKTKSGPKIPLPKRVCDKLLFSLEKVYEIDGNLDLVGIDGCFIKKNKKSLSLWSSLLRKMFVLANGKEVTLQAFIAKHGLYSICFSDPKYMYFMGQCFEDTAGLSEIDSILDILVPVAGIGIATSEKGVFTTASSSFQASTVFAFVEQMHQNDDYLFCDDLGDEWADHIAFNKTDSCIAFIHSKHGAVSTSASNLHDVVGQGIKNIGNMFFDAPGFMSKYNKKLSKKYSGTKISRRRKGSPYALNRYLKPLLGDYRLHRKCILACTFLSKADVAAEFQKIKNSKPVSGHVIQLLWIISSFAHAAKDMSVIPIIYCKA